MKRHPFKKAKSGELIPVTARQLESFMLEHNGRFNSRDYDKFERMELMESPVRDAIHELKTYSLETLARYRSTRTAPKVPTARASFLCYNYRYE